MALSARTKPLLHEQPLPLRRSVDIAGAPELVAPAALRARRGRPGSRQRGGNRALHLRRYAELGSIRLLKEELDAQGFTSKRLRSPLGDKPFARGALDLMLQNRIYLARSFTRNGPIPANTPRLSYARHQGCRAAIGRGTISRNDITAAMMRSHPDNAKRLGSTSQRLAKATTAKPR